MKRAFLIAFTLLIFISCSEEDMPGGDDPSDIQDPPANNLAVGATANELLSGEQFEKLVLEIQYPQGYAPPSGTINDVKAFFNKYANKPGGINVIQSEITVPANTLYSAQEIVQIEENNRTQFNTDNTMAVYLFLTDGDYEGNEGNSKVLGIAYRNTSMALFQKTIKDLSGGVGQPSERMVTTTVLNHEVGHIFGLVNVGTPMVTEHQDEAHGKHCDNTSCLMYWTADTGNVIDNLLGLSSPPDLDAQCQADLEANGGK